MRRTERAVTGTEEIKEILDSCKVCRLGLCDDGQVYIVPMNYGYTYEEGRLTIYFHGAKEGRKLDIIKKHPSVGIEMDCSHELVEGALACQYSYYYASLIGNGRAEVVEEPEEKLKALGLVMKQQTGKEFDEFKTNPKLEKAVGIIKVNVEQFSCKKHMKK